MTRPWSILILGAILYLGLYVPVGAVGPYFENERSAGEQIPVPAPKTLIPGPNLVPPKQTPDVGLPEVTRLVKGTLVDMDKYIYVVREESLDSNVAIKITPDTRFIGRPRVGDKVEAQVRSNDDAWSVKAIP
jgi:hypothetical protein